MKENVFTDAEAWYEYAESIKETDALFAFFNATFSQSNLTLDFFEEAGMMDTFFILSDHLMTEKRFDDYLHLRNVIKTKQPAIYAHEFIYFDDTLLKYALYNDDEALAKDAFEKFIEDPDRDIDTYLPLLRLIALYGKGDWVEEIADKNYDSVNDGDYIGAPALELALYVYHHRLGVEYQKFKETGNFDSEALFTRLRRFQLDKFQEKDKIELIDALIKPLPDANTLQSAYNTDKQNTLRILGNSFKRYAYEEKQMPFIVSGTIWDLMTEYWFREKGGKGIYSIDYKSFDEYNSSLIGFFGQYLCNNIAVIVGSTYVYDFLHQTGLTTDTVHQNALEVINRLLKPVYELKAYLWKNGFLKNWQKADSTNPLEYQKLIANIDFAYNDKQVVEFKPFEEHYGFDNIGKSLPNFDKSEPNFVPVRTDPKIGRNDPCPCGSGKKYKKCCGA